MASDLLDKAAEVLREHSQTYMCLGDCHEPDLYHCYREGAKRFKISGEHPEVELYIVSGKMLGMHDPPKRIIQGLTLEMAHSEIAEYCIDVDPKMLADISWPSLEDYLGGWLRLSVGASTSPVEAVYVTEIVYLMYAEKLVDANEVTDEWFEKNYDDAKVVEAGKKLLARKMERPSEEEWTPDWGTDPR